MSEASPAAAVGGIPIGAGSRVAPLAVPLLCVAVLAAGVAFSIHLQTTVREGVFTQGDLAMKYLFTRQLVREGFSLEMRLPAAAWERDLWTRGLHPFPFAVRTLRGREFLYYPPTFPAVSAPFYRAFGFRGLYILPLVSTWAIWLSFVCIGARYGLSDRWRAVMLAVLIFATPLTFYSATFWEHTLAVALAFPPLAFALSPPSPVAVGAAPSFSLGMTMGLGCWFREELLFLAALAAAFVAVSSRLRPCPALAVRRWAFVCGAATAVVLFLAFNLAVYGMLLGLHGTDFVGWLSQWARARDAARFLAGSLWHHYPLGLALLALLAALWWRLGWGPVARPAILLLLSTAFSIAVPALAHHEGGRQFGPRFLLIVFPITALAGGLLLQEAVAALRPWGRRVLLVATATLVVFGIKTNAVDAEHHLRVNYQRRLLSYNAVRNSEPRTVAVSHEFVAQELADLVGTKALFLTRDAVQLKQLGRELARQGEGRLLYLCYPQYPCRPFSALPPEMTLYAAGSPLLHFEKVGTFDRYVMYEGTVLVTPTVR